MSLKFSSLVWKQGPRDHFEFMVLLALAEYADTSGLCWPSIETIATRSRLSKSTVIRAMKKLEIDGWYSTVRKSREHKGNTYSLAVDRLLSGVSETPELAESGARETPESAKVRCLPDKSQVSDSAKSGVCGEKPPDPLKGRTVINRKEPFRSAPSEPAIAELVLTPEATPKRKHEPDPRHGPIWRFIADTYLQRNQVNCPDPAKCNGALAQFLKGCDWSTEEIRTCITNRFDSDRPPPSESPFRWIARLATWRDGALDTYGSLKTEGGTNGKRNVNRAQEAADSTFAGARAALASFGFDCGPLGETGPDDGGANGQGRRPVTIDGRRPRGLTGG